MSCSISSNSRIQPALNITSTPRHNALMLGNRIFDSDDSLDKVYKFVLGLDFGKPKLMSDEELSNTQDPFIKLLKNGKYPTTVHELFDAFEATRGQPEGLKKREIHLLGEGGQIRWSEQTAAVNRFFRLAIHFKTSSKTHMDTFVSSGTNIESKQTFLQVMSWDPVQKWFNFYQRLDERWVLAGNSSQAFDDKTRGKGPFGGHVNGGPVMKELKAPWQHWHSQSRDIPKTSFSPTDVFANDEALFTNLKGGENFEILIRAGIHQWNVSRIAKALQTNPIKNAPHFMRQILETTTVNLSSSINTTEELRSQETFTLPNTFFINQTAFENLGLSLTEEPIALSSEFYLHSLKKYEYTLINKTSGFEQAGDTVFPFFIPEPAAEDNDLLKLLIKNNFFNARFAACLLMVDFANPVYSDRRAKLMAYVPLEIVVTDGKFNLADQMVKAITQSAASQVEGSPEWEFLKNWEVPEESWQQNFQAKIASYFQALQNMSSTQEGVDQLMRLVESRRVIFRESPLSEFDLTFSVPKNMSQEDFPLEMGLDGKVKSK